MLELVTLLVGVAPTSAAPTLPPASTLAVRSRLDDRRFVVSGTRAYEVGTEAGGYPAMGFHTRGEMGGIWAPPIKLLDGIWFGVDGQWIGPATSFASGYGHVTMQLPKVAGVGISRTDFVPDGRRALIVRLTLASSDRTRNVNLTVDAHSELMSAYPWGDSVPSQTNFNLADSVGFDGRRLLFREVGRPPVSGAEAHDWAAVVGASLEPIGHREGAAFRGPQDPPIVCPASAPGTSSRPPRCDDTVYGKGAGGQLVYRLHLPAGGTRTVWVAVAGSDLGLSQAQAEYQAAMADPGSALAEKVAARRALAARTRLSLPGDPLLAQGIDWGKQNLADSVQEVTRLRVRPTHSAKTYPPPVGRVDGVRFVAAGFPDYPWLFATDGEYTAYALAAVGQFEAAEDHLRALRDASLAMNGMSGKVIHEVVSDGSVYFGTNSDPGNTDETAKFPSAVALLWRWTGDQRFLDEMYGFVVANLHYVVDQDSDHDGWPLGLGNVERPGMGQKKLDNAVYTVRGLRDLQAMADSRGDTATSVWAGTKAARMEQAFDRAWWMPEVPQHADSLHNPGQQKLQQRHWIGVTPMEVELVHGFDLRLGLTTPTRGADALGLRETPCYGNSYGLFHTGASGCDPVVSSVPAERKVFTINTAVMAVAEGNYGRLGPDRQQRFTTGNRQLQLPDPDEQPGVMPEIGPSPDYRRSIDQPFTDRASVMQAWGNYGTAWPIVHQQLGVRPDLGNDRLEVTPQVPPASPGIAAADVRLGKGSIDVEAHCAAGIYTTTVRAGVGSRLTIGATVPRGARISSVMLDGSPVPHRLRVTNRGEEVLTEAHSGETHTLVVAAS